MATVTQTVPTYTGGISQQPDELKVPGQVNKATNIIPDVTLGLTKRPGGRFLASLSDTANFDVPHGSLTNRVYDPDAQTNGKWFSYYRDEVEQYIGQIDRGGEVRMWKCSDGTPVKVIYDGGHGSATDTALKLYLNHNGDEDIQTLTLNDFTYITNRGTLKSDGSAHPKTTVAMKALTAGEYNPDATVTADKNKNDERPAEAYIDLKKISYSSQYSVNLFDSTTSSTISTATRIQIERDADSSNTCASDGSMPSNNTAIGTGSYTSRCTNAAGNSQDAYCPNVDTRIFAISAGQAGDADDANGVAHNYNVVRGGSTYNSGEMANLYFRIATIGQSVAQGGSQSNPDYQCRYTTTHDLLYGGEGWETGDYFDVWMKDARYRVTIKDHSVSKIQATMDGNAGSGAIRPMPTPFDNETTITAESILGEIMTIIETYNNCITASETQQIGTGLYLTDGDPFNISTSNGDLMTVFARNVNTVEDLPAQCKNGYVVKVTNSDADEDDYWVKFIGENAKDGSGVWEEWPEPGRLINYDEETMPVQLIRLQDNGKDENGDNYLTGTAGEVTGTSGEIYFKVSHPTWEKCQVGDDVTNPKPTFVGKKISRLIFFRNRLCVLAGTNIIMSRPGDYFNFWAKSAITYANSDPIDISISSKYPSTIYDGIQINNGLILFTKNEQFMVTTDSDILNPTTAKINSISDYSFNHKSNPVSLGTSIGFLDNAGKYTRFFEMAGIRREVAPKIVEQSKVVSKLFDANLNIISASRENSIIFFSERGKSTIYGFRYFNSAEKRTQQAWFTWELSGDLQYHCALDDSFYAVVRNGTKDVMQKFDIKMLSDSRQVTDDMDTTDTSDDKLYRVHLDNSKIITASQLGYSATTGRTGFTKPDGFNSTKQLAVFCHVSGNEVGRYAEASVVGNPGNYNIEFDGDWTGQDLTVGYLFDMEVEFPTIHITRQEQDAYRSDTRGSLVIHRIKLSLGDAGQYSTLLQRTGKPDYTELFEPPYADNYNANQLPIKSESIRTVPIYDRNINCNIILKSTHPSPATLQSMTWEGEYTPKYYSRV